MNNLEANVKGLDITVQTQLIIGLSLSMAYSSKIKSKGLNYFKKKLREYFEEGKPIELSKHFVKAAIQFIRVSNKFTENAEEVKFFLENSSHVLKDPLYKNLAMVDKPAVSLPRSKPPGGGWFDVVEDSKLKLSQIIEEYGPQVTNSNDTIK